MKYHAVWLSACALLFVPTLAGCSTTSTEKGATAANPKTFAAKSDPRDYVSSVDPTRGKVMSDVELRHLLDRLLSEHSALAVQMMRSIVDRSPDETAITNALLENTDDLTGAIGIVYGPDGAFAFDQLWKQHIQFFANYAAATDGRSRAKALADLHDYQMDFSSFTTTATGGRLPLKAVVSLLHTHVAQLVAQLDSYRAGNLTEAVTHQHEACVHMYEISAGLAGAIADQQPIVFPADAPAQTASTVDTAITTAHLRSEILQLQLDEGWAGIVRPALVPAVKAFASSDTFASFSTGDARANVELCVKAIKQRQFEKAAACSRSLLASLPTVGS